MASHLKMSTNQHLKKYLIQFAHEHLDFRIPEIKSIVSVLGCEACLQEKDVTSKSPFLEIKLKNDSDAINIMKRSFLSKRIIELWTEGSCVTEVADKIKRLSPDFIKENTDPDKSFCLNVETFNKKLSSAEKIKKIELITDTSEVFQRKIDLKSPDIAYHLYEEYGYRTDGQSMTDPSKVYFGRWVADGQRDLIQKYHLQKRNFIANTSMDACLSFVMTNMGQVKNDDFVFDPFVGSGGLLVSCAHFGAYVMGTDIDYLLLHARAKPSRAKKKTRDSNESISNNLKQYNLENKYIDVAVADSSRHDLWRSGVRFDAIVTDPPYGIREAAAKIATMPEAIEAEGEQRFPQKTQYSICDIYVDLLNFAAKFLELNGRLVYWLPVYKPEYQESNIPQHPCLRLEYNSEQLLSTNISRRLITMVKHTEFQEQSVHQGATIPVNMFEHESFREKYFKAVET